MRSAIHPAELPRQRLLRDCDPRSLELVDLASYTAARSNGTKRNNRQTSIAGQQRFALEH